MAHVTEMGPKPLKQVAALPYRIEADGRCLILLVTSRDTGRWIIPKGNPIHGLAPYLAAAREAYEEAGLIGHPESRAIGSFRYNKRKKSGAIREALVEVFPLPVATQLEVWPEKHERETRWFACAEAAALVAEPELSELIRAFRPDGGVDSPTDAAPPNNRSASESGSDI